MVNDLTIPDNWWAEYAADYENRSWKNYRPLLSEFVRHSEPPLLDVGCGRGYLVECARRFGIDAVGLEGSEQAVEMGKKMHPLADIRLWKGGEDLPVESGSIGGAVLNEFVDHITVEQNRILFREIFRVLRPGGQLIVRSPSKHNKFDDDQGHLTFFSPSEFLSFVHSFGFDVVSQPYVAQPLLGSSKIGADAMRVITMFVKPEKWAARIDLVAKKPDETKTANSENG